jgi:hypothetical protein
VTMAPALPDTAPVGALVALMSTGFDRALPDTPTLYTADGELDALHLSSVVFDARRARPLLVATRGGNHRAPADLAELAATLWPTADVVDVRNHEVAQAFCARVPSWLAAYGGQVRLYLPGTDLSDDGKHHPLITREPQGCYEKKIASTVTGRTRQHRRTDPARKLADIQAAHERTKSDLARARDEIARLKDAAADLDDDDPVFSDPEAQFDHELYQAWLRTTPEPDRDEWGLRGYTLGPDFLDSLDRLEVARRRVLRACVDVITGRYPHITGRDAKRFKGTVATSGAGKPNLVRDSDGAAAWRCSIQMSGLAARLMWWERPNGEPELSCIAEHNDFRIT